VLEGITTIINMNTTSPEKLAIMTDVVTNTEKILKEMEGELPQELKDQ